MSELVETLLILARADEGRAPLALQEVDLRDLVGEAVETAGILGEGAGIAVTSTLPEKPVLLAVDGARIRQLLLNLVTNAIKYNDAGGSVALDLVDQGSAVVITVRDTGIGIAAGDLPHVIRPVWRADLVRSRVRRHSGFGLGSRFSRVDRGGPRRGRSRC
jgi:signal transduction histidine kinase